MLFFFHKKYGYFIDFKSLIYENDENQAQRSKDVPLEA